MIRYEQMVRFMEKLVHGTSPAVKSIIEERSLLSVANKKVIGSLRAAWRIVSSIEQNEESRKNKEHVILVKKHRSKTETEWSDICASILTLLDLNLVPAAAASELGVLHLEMKEDYHRYLAEYISVDERKAAAESTTSSYQAAQDIAMTDLAPAHLIRLVLL